MIEWEAYSTELDDILRLDLPVYAHMDEDGEKPKETLKEHTALCEKYFIRLLRKKKMENSILSLEEALIPEAPQETVTWFREALYGIFIFHDTGKINPLFQSIRMNNPVFDRIRLCSPDSSNHSMLSSAIYLDYFLKRLTELKPANQWRIRLYQLLCINACIISRHHSSLEQYQKYVMQLQTGGAVDRIWKEMEENKYKELYKGRFSEIQADTLYSQMARISDKLTEKQKFARYIYARLLYSLLTACDYYATNEYVTGAETVYFGSADEIREMRRTYEETPLVKSIRKFHPKKTEDDGKDINYLRNLMFQEAERNLLHARGSRLFFLEAPTGSGKSNMALNLSFQLLEEDMDKVIYVYPFNNLVEQNKASLQEIFGETLEYRKMAVLNSITPIPCEREEGEYPAYYAKALLDRQFLNYPLILTTHVSLFQTMFGTEREALFGFHQLAGCVLVLDEIQSYKNTMWTEMIRFLQYFAQLLHGKTLIMSATLPDFELLTGQKEDICRLIRNRESYFGDARFKNRVKISYELMRHDFTVDLLYEHVKKMTMRGKKILVEFIKKDMAYEFYNRFSRDEEVTVPIERMTGDDNPIDRELILRKAKDEEYCRNGFLLIATQVVEAGLDIDMDIGYKDTSLLDSEEQFIGRINRNYRGEGEAYFFNLCEATKIYKKDYRVNKAYTLDNPDMQEILVNKDFSRYYTPVLRLLQSEWNESFGDEGMRRFLEEMEILDFKAIEKRMKLIEEASWDMSVYLARRINTVEGEILDGEQIWKEYKTLLSSPHRDYAKFRIELSRIRSRMNNFIYRIRKNSDLAYNDRIGELYYLDHGEQYFENGKLNRDRLTRQNALFLDI